MVHTSPQPDPQFLALQEALAGRYSIIRELGRGGMGIVYLADEVRLERPVALKVLPPELAAQPAFRERFLREARTAAQLSHPHIVPVHAVDEVDDVVFFAMAYVEGETLGERVRQRGPLSPPEAARILKEVAWALGYAHAQGVVHRDVKPDNILLEAGGGRAMVTDFGIARVSRPGPELTGSAEVVGTAEFMSPEQASGETADGRSDIYSLGVVGHYSLTGRLPFQGETVVATLAQQMTRPAPPLRSVAPEVPAPLARVLDRCLAKDPNSRFANGEELGSALGGALERKREVPAAVRAFLEETQGEGMALATSIGYGTWTSAWAVAVIATGTMPGWAAAGVGAVGLGFLLAPAAILIQQSRRLLRSGHESDELVSVLADEVEERRRALSAAGADEPSWLDRWLRRLTWAGVGTFSAGLGWLGWGPYVESPLFWTGYLAVMSGSAIAFFGGGFLSAVRDSGPRGVRGQRWLRLWRSPFGRGVFRAAGVGLDRPLPAGPGYRPTAVAIGMAADRLFRELPPALRREFEELPAVVEALEADAGQVRTRIRDLDDALAEVAPEGSDAGGAAGRQAVADDIETVRAAAEARLAEVVAALESIRLQLIRMHAGIGSPQLLTQHLGHARSLAGRIERVAAGAREVDELLGIEATREDDRATPTPAGGR